MNLKMEGMKKESLLNELKEIHSCLLQKTYSKECVGLLDEQEKVLFCPYFISDIQSPSVPSADLLLWLTIWRTGFELCDQFGNIPESKLRHLFNVLKRYLLSTNRYIAYETQRVYVAVLKKLNLQCAIEDISSQLRTTSTETLEAVYSYTEICRELLSRHNAHALPFFDDIRQSLLIYISTLFQNRGHSKFHSCLFQLILILIKIVKLIAWYQHENAVTFIIEVINTHVAKLLDLLFDCSIQNGFVWRKVCRLWFRIFCLIDLKDFESRNVILRQCALCTVEKIHTFGIYMLFPSDVRTEQSSQTRLGFTGSFLKSSSGYNSDMRLAEGCMLCLKACECLTTRPGDGRDEKIAQEKSNTVIQNLDVFLQEAVPYHSNLPYCWLPQLFSEQDDSWIEAMLILLNIDTLGKLPVVKTAVCLNHHHYFRQFVSSTGYDHTIVVDLLTSPETSFLTYFTKYLKYSFKTWDKFVEEYNSCGESHEIKLRTGYNEAREPGPRENGAEYTAEITSGEEIGIEIDPLVEVHKQTVCSSSSGNNENKQNSGDQSPKKTKYKTEEIMEDTGKGFACENFVAVLSSAESSRCQSVENKEETKYEKESQIDRKQKLVTGNGSASCCKVKQLKTDCQPHSVEDKLSLSSCLDKNNEENDSVANCMSGKRHQPILHESVCKKFKSNVEGSKSNVYDVKNSQVEKEISQNLVEDNSGCCAVESLNAILESVEYLEQESSGDATRDESRENEIEHLELTYDGELISCDTQSRQKDVYVKEGTDSGSYHVEGSDHTKESEGNKHLLHKDSGEKLEIETVLDKQKCDNFKNAFEKVRRGENVDQQSELLLKDRQEGDDSEEQSDNEMDSLEFFEEVKNQDTRRLEDTQYRHQTVVVTEDDDFESFEISNDSYEIESAEHKGQKKSHLFISKPSNKTLSSENKTLSAENQINSPTLKSKIENLNSTETRLRAPRDGNKDIVQTTERKLQRSHHLDPQLIAKSDMNRIYAGSELEKELETVEFQETVSQDKMIFRLENYDINDLETLLELENETQSPQSKTFDPNQISKFHSSSTNELSENANSHEDNGMDQQEQQHHDEKQLFQNETTALQHGLVDYVMSDEDEELIMNSEEMITHSEETENAQSVEKVRESEAFEKNAEFLDEVMSVLIRVRIKLEKLKTAGILQYNPQPLVKLICALEEKYESG